MSNNILSCICWLAVAFWVSFGFQGGFFFLYLGMRVKNNSIAKLALLNYEMMLFPLFCLVYRVRKEVNLIDFSQY